MRGASLEDREPKNMLERLPRRQEQKKGDERGPPKPVNRRRRSASVRKGLSHLGKKKEGKRRKEKREEIHLEEGPLRSIRGGGKGGLRTGGKLSSQSKTWIYQRIKSFLFWGGRGPEERGKGRAPHQLPKARQPMKREGCVIARTRFCVEGRRGTYGLQKIVGGGFAGNQGRKKSAI